MNNGCAPEWNDQILGLYKNAGDQSLPRKLSAEICLEVGLKRKEEPSFRLNLCGKHDPWSNLRCLFHQCIFKTPRSTLSFFKNPFIKHVLYSLTCYWQLAKAKGNRRVGSLWESTRTQDSPHQIPSLARSLARVTKRQARLRATNRWAWASFPALFFRRRRQKTTGNPSAFPDYRQNILTRRRRVEPETSVFT